MEFIVENWYLILAGICLGALAVYSVIQFTKLPRDKQIECLMRWLEGAVSEAENALGSGTGQLKLRRVYSGFVAAFPWLAQRMSFETFSGYVDKALKWMNSQAEVNKAIETFIGGKL